MLVLSRHGNERVIINIPREAMNGEDDLLQLQVVIVAVRGDKVRLGFDAPKAVEINRFEVQRKIDGHDEEVANALR